MAGLDQQGEPSSRSSTSLPTPTAAPVTTSLSAPARPSTLQLRRSSSGANASVSGTRLTRRVTTQERLDGILEVEPNLHPTLYLVILLHYRGLRSML